MELVLLTTAAQPTTEVLPALGLLGHQVIINEFDVSPLLTTSADAVLIDARFNLALLVSDEHRCPRHAEPARAGGRGDGRDVRRPGLLGDRRR